MRNVINCAFFNARSLCNKLPDLYSLLDGSLYNRKFNLLFVCETWLTDNITNGLLLYNSNDYVLIRHDRTGGVGGGVCVFIDNSLIYFVVSLLDEFASLEVVCIDVLQGNDRHRYICIYRPPSYDIVQTGLLTKCMSHLCDGKSFTICTDFNLPNFNWNCNFDVNNLCSLDACLADFIVCNGAMQLISEPTRKSNTLDLLLVNDSMSTYDVTVAAPFSTSDHCMLTWRAHCPVSKASPSMPKHDYRRADYNGLSLYFSNVDWLAIFAQVPPSDVNGVWLVFKNVLSQAVDVFVPLVGVKRRRKLFKYPLFVRRALKRKQALWRCRHQPGMLEQYKQQAARCKRLICKCHVRAEKRLIKSESVSAFYRHVNRKLDNCQRIPPIRAANGAMITHDGDKVEAFNKFFTSVFSRSDPHMQSAVKPDRMSAPVDFSVHAVQQSLKQAKRSRSSGPDGFPSMFWANLSSELALPVSIILSLSYSFAVLPNDWRHALVVPLHKKGDPSQVSNYRPISLTSTLCKVMETMINKNLQRYSSAHSIIDSNQHGFFPGRSTCTQLLESQYEWCAALDNNVVSDVILIDFSKAFDVVPHSKLINKLASLGVCHPTLRWITAFLSNRSQSVVLNGVFSSPSAVTSGVIQGSVLGPTLFALYVSDLPTACPDCSIGQYADDTKASRQITKPHDRVMLQGSLNALCSWAEQHELALSLDKCLYLQVGYSDSTITYTVGSRSLKPSQSVTDLGIVVQSNLKPGLHCTQVATKANARARLILKSFLSRDASCLTRAFITYVRPLLEYATPVWSPHFKQDVDLIEGVQRVFTRKLFYICNLPPATYDERLRLLGLQRLELRRLHYDVCLMFKLTHGIINCHLRHAISLAPRAGLRGHRYKLHVLPAKKLVLSSHFIHRTVPVWNSLPDSCFVPDSYSVFKRKIVNINLCKYLIGKA